MAGSQWINDLENVTFAAPAGKLFTSVSIELECEGPDTRLHDVQVYYYINPGVMCEQQLIEPPLYAAKTSRRSWRQLLHPGHDSVRHHMRCWVQPDYDRTSKWLRRATLLKPTTFGRRPLLKLITR